MVALLLRLVTVKCYMALPHDVVGWSAVCGCGIS